LVDLFRSLGLAPFENTPCQRSDEEHSRVFQISLDEVYILICFGSMHQHMIA
jgi:hypothetical protein